MARPDRFPRGNGRLVTGTLAPTKPCRFQHEQYPILAQYQAILESTKQSGDETKTSEDDAPRRPRSDTKG